MTSAELVAAGHAQREAFAGVDQLLAGVTGQAQDSDGTVAALVGARGELRALWLADEAVGWGPDRLAELIVRAAQDAARDAVQRSYDTLAPVLGDTLTAAMAAVDTATAAGARRVRRPDR